MPATHPPPPSNPGLERLSDRALLDEFNELVRRDHHHVASLLRHIDVIDRRQLWAKLGHPSMFAFLVTRYHMSESTAVKRIGAARAARRFPVLFTMVAEGDIHLSGIHRLKAHLTPENYEHVLAAAKHKTIRQIEELVARLAPKPDVPSTLRALPHRATTATAALTLTAPVAPAHLPPIPASAASCALASPPPAPPPAQRRAPDPAPLSPGRYRLQVTLSEGTKDKLKQLQDLLGHQIPNGDPAAIIERALDALLEQVHKRTIAATEKPRARKATTAPPRWVRSIPAVVRREVWKRDEGRCAFIGEDGHRCNETRCLEFAHLEPWAKGGATTVENIALWCQAHNAFEANRDYGTSFMARKRDSKREPEPKPEPNPKPNPKPWNVREPVARYAMSPMPCAAESC